MNLLKMIRKKTVVIDNSSKEDNVFINNSNTTVICCCEEAFGCFKVVLKPDQKRAVVPNARVSVFLYDGKAPDFDYRNFDYDIGCSGKWQIVLDSLGHPVMRKM